MVFKNRLCFAFGDGPTGRASVVALRSVSGHDELWSGYRTRGGPTAERHGPKIHLRIAEGLASDAEGYEPTEAVNVWLGQQIFAIQVRPFPGARGLMINMTDIDPAHEDEFNEWYDTEHFDRLSHQSGLLSAGRFRAIRGSPSYVAIYRLNSPAAVQTPAWVTASMTPWTKRIGRFRTNNQRWVLAPDYWTNAAPVDRI